ncbi:hypothetical protein BP6252_06123 [Coleophoma cylindrospora]|uniref:Early meiotic induction protein 1 n=1 Tax=Coleophoma cylindrospora TaxID=1849047 RepID=A0A3D8RMF9_9HELO|nr:hypothetical protein BP6252_06123 [Coleophoma cylindrospora]
MGWLWKDTQPTAAPNAPLSEATPTTIPEASPATKPLSREERAEQELQSFLAELTADTQPSSTKYNRVPKQVPSPGAPRNASDFNPRSQRQQAIDSNPESLSESLLPRTMSCREAFDAAFYCQSLGGQFNNLYRYGTVRSCSENWNDFWFCMRVRTRGDEEKESLIKDHYRERERRRYGRGDGAVRVEDGRPLRQNEDGAVPRSSEDIWKSREQKMEWGEAFSTPHPVWTGSDAEWQMMERARRAGRVNGTSS